MFQHPHSWVLLISNLSTTLAAQQFCQSVFPPSSYVMRNPYSMFSRSPSCSFMLSRKTHHLLPGFLLTLPFSTCPYHGLWVRMVLPCWEFDFNAKCISTFHLVIWAATLVTAVRGSNTTAHTSLVLNWLTQQLLWYRAREHKTNSWAELTCLINPIMQA